MTVRRRRIAFGWVLTTIMLLPLASSSAEASSGPYATDVTTSTATLVGALKPPEERERPEPEREEREPQPPPIDPPEVHWHFVYAPSPTCWGAGASATPEQIDLALGSQVTAQVTGLAPGTTYTVCLVQYPGTTGPAFSFTTLAAPVAPEGAAVSLTPAPAVQPPHLPTTHQHSSLARALRACARKPRNVRHRCVRRAHRRFGAKRT